MAMNVFAVPEASSQMPAMVLATFFSSILPR
jgi:hypothetical protein